MQILAITSAFLITWVFSVSGFAEEKGTRIVRASKEGVSFQDQLTRRLAAVKRQIKSHKIKLHKKASPTKGKGRSPSSVAVQVNTVPLSVDEAAYVANAEQALAKMDPEKAKKLGALILTMANDTVIHPEWVGDSQKALNKYTSLRTSLEIDSNATPRGSSDATFNAGKSLFYASLQFAGPAGAIATTAGKTAETVGNFLSALSEEQRVNERALLQSSVLPVGDYSSNAIDPRALLYS